MLAQKFFKLFPPPKFLDIPYAGLDISDDALRCIEYSRTRKGLVIHRYGTIPLSPGIVDRGEIKNSEALTDAISHLSRELKIHSVRASLPEEKMYLFKTEVPSMDVREIRQNIEFKLEENVPLSADEAIFFFDLIPKSTGVDARAPESEGNPVGVSVAPRSLVLSYLEAIKAAGLVVLSFDVQAKAIARALVPHDSPETNLLVYIMDNKTGLYVVVGGVVCFTSTIAWGESTAVSSLEPKVRFNELRKAIEQVVEYWNEHGLGTRIGRVVITGHGALLDGLVSECSAGLSPTGEEIKFEIGNVWNNAFSHDTYVPPIPYEKSLDYSVAAGLALPEYYQFLKT